MAAGGCRRAHAGAGAGFRVRADECRGGAGAVRPDRPAGERLFLLAGGGGWARRGDRQGRARLLRRGFGCVAGAGDGRGAPAECAGDDDAACARAARLAGGRRPWRGADAHHAAALGAEGGRPRSGAVPVPDPVGCAVRAGAAAAGIRAGGAANWCAARSRATSCGAPRILAPVSLRSGDRFAPLMGAATRFWTARAAARGGSGAGGARTGAVSCRPAKARSRAASWPGRRSKRWRRGRACWPSTLPCSTWASGFRCSRGRRSSWVSTAGIFWKPACFAPPGAGVCAIRGNAPRSFALLGVAQSLGHAFGYVFGTLDREDAGAAAVVDAAMVQQAITALSLVDR